MIQASEDWAVQAGFAEIVLHARANVVPMYEKLGYEVIGEPFEEVTIPHRKMRKSLTS
jgi:predicted GNAT family N-acyltransferase